MSKLWPIFIFSLVMAALSERYSIYKLDSLGGKRYLYKEKVFYAIMVVSMAVFVGLRTAYNDTGTYMRAYELSSTLLSDIDWALGANPGFNLTNLCLKILGVSAQNFLMLYALVTVCVYLWFIRKYTDNIWLSIFLFSTMGCYTFTMAAIKQCVAVAFCLIGTDQAIQKRWKGFVFWILLASTFHPYSLMYAVVPLLMFNPWTTNTYWMLGGFGVLGICLEALLGTILSVTSMMGEEYDASSFIGEGVNIFRLAVVWVPVIMSFLARNFLRKNDDRATNLIMNLSMLNAEIMFVALFGTANYFARLANYFLIFQAISLPWLMKYFTYGSKKLLYWGTCLGFLLYFYYSNGILYGGFDNMYKMINFFEYIKTAF